jgi:hypothetical protein
MTILDLSMFDNLSLRDLTAAQLKTWLAARRRTLSE